MEQSDEDEEEEEEDAVWRGVHRFDPRSFKTKNINTSDHLLISFLQLISDQWLLVTRSEVTVEGGQGAGHNDL